MNCQTLAIPSSTAGVSRPLDMFQWLHMRACVPGDWQIVQHSAAIRQGRLILADRRQQRMQLSWLACPQPPDLERVFHDYRRMDLGAQPEARFEELPGDLEWRGYRRVAGNSALTRAGRWSAPLGRWIELGLDWPEGFDTALEATMLSRFRIVSGAEGERIRAFGLDVTPPAGWLLRYAKVKPADAALIFSNGSDTAMVRRRAWINPFMPSAPAAYLWSLHPDLPEKPRPVAYLDHAAAAGEAWISPSLLWRWLGWGKKRRDLAWHCPAAAAGFQITTTAARQSRIGPSDFRLVCCGRSAA